MDTTISHQSKKMSSEYKSDVPNELIEQQTKKIPNLLFLGLGLVSMIGSFALAVNRKRELANFVGQWVPTLLIFGVYNKIVKVEDELIKMRMH